MELLLKEWVVIDSYDNGNLKVRCSLWKGLPYSLGLKWM